MSTHVEDEEPTAEPAPEPEPKGKAKATRLREERAEIAEEPGNHGRFAFGCSVAVVVALALFFLVRVFLMR